MARARKRPLTATSGRLTVLVLAGLLIFTGCGSSSAKSVTSGPTKGGTLTDASTFNNGDPAHIDPALARDSQSGEIASLLYEGLTRTSVKGVVQNAVASSVTPTTNNLVWTFTLRSGVKFSNGDPVLPSSFKFAWTRAADPAFTSITNSYVRLVKEVDADDANNTLTVTLNRPAPDFDAMVAMPVFAPLPADAFTNSQNSGFVPTTAFTQWESGLMIGDGPFKMASPWKHNTSITLVRNDSYYGGIENRTPYLDGINFRIFADAQTSYNNFTVGGIDTTQIVPGKALEAARNYQPQFVTDPLLSTQYWGFNYNDANVGGDDNAPLRKAIAMTINRKDISINTFRGAYVSATGWAAPGTPGYQVRLSSGDRNVEAAKDVLRAWGKPLPAITISFPSVGIAPAEAESLKSNLADIGISATLNSLSPSVFSSSLAAGQLQFFYGTYQANYVSYDDVLATPFATDGPANVFNYSDPVLDASITAARAEPNAAQRGIDYSTAERAMLLNQPIAPSQWASSLIITSDRVQSLHVDPLGYTNYADVWMES